MSANLGPTFSSYLVTEILAIGAAMIATSMVIRRLRPNSIWNRRFVPVNTKYKGIDIWRGSLLLLAGIGLIASVVFLNQSNLYLKYLLSKL